MGSVVSVPKPIPIKYKEKKGKKPVRMNQAIFNAAITLKKS
jgi:hypothetical protein